MALAGFIVAGSAGCGSSSGPKTDAKTDTKADGAAGSAGGGGGAGSGGAGSGGAGSGGVSGGGGGGVGGTDAGVGTAGVDGNVDATDAPTDKGDAAGDAASDVKVDGGPEAGPEAGSDVKADAGDAGDAETGSDTGPSCTNVCTLGNHQCGTNGGTQTCVLAGTGCTVWGTETACGTRQTCSSGTCVCNTAPTGCSQAGTFCDGSGNLATCALDAQGCHFISGTPAACPTHETCQGALPSAACTCNNECLGTSAFCVDVNTRATCTADSNTPACHTITGVTSCQGSQTCSGGACVCPAIGMTAGTGCATLAMTRCSGDDILTCVTESASGCSIWQASTHCAANVGGALTCGTKGGPAACQCLDNAGTTVYVDPSAGSDVATGLFPTGVQTPAACRYQTLTTGLAKIATAGTVIAISASVPATFMGETFPLAVPTGATLTTADNVATPGDYIIEFNGASAATAVILETGATLKGLSIVNNGGNTGATLVSCSAGAATLDSLLLDGKGAVTTGLDLLGSCAASLHLVDIQGLTGTALDADSSGTSTISGGSLMTSLRGLHQRQGMLSATNLVVASDGNEGILLDTGSPSLTLTGGQVNENGFSGGSPGIRVATGTLTVSGTSLTGDNTAGISVANGTSVDLSAVSVSGAVTGLLVSGGTVTASGLTVGQSTGDGVAVTGGMVSMTGSTSLTASTGNGVSLSGGSVSLTGGVISTNSVDGIACSSGTLIVQGGAEVKSNTGAGLDLMGCTATVAGANIHDNTGDGVTIDSSNASSIGLGTPSSATTIAANKMNGIVVHQSPANGSDANTVTIDTVTISGNTGVGVFLVGDTGSIGATIRNNTIPGNHDTGVLIDQGAGNTTREAIQSNDVSGNNTAGGHSVGGVFFETASTLTSMVSNKIHSNGGDELGFAARSNPPVFDWSIAPAGGTCGTSSNTLSCYGTGKVGLRVLGVVPITVDADGTRWASATPANGVDYSASSGSVTVASPCADPPTATCP
ncbi:MAG TPA: right-handed parallel beta-helix repeat-containing protein [Polyangia bacterium]|nr:right-handed parallel beta-helix repeat-containing protein [Polyangia bacterium]